MTQERSAAPPPTLVVGASAGGVEALRELVTGLPADAAFCVLVVLHLPAGAPSALPAILRRAGVLPVRTARDGQPLEPGVVLVAPPDHHLLVLDGVVGLSHGPKENGHRPAVDVLFRSAARALRERALAVVLSGTLDDGAAGAAAVAAQGGRVIVQEPEEALYGGMPRAAAAAVPTAVAAPAAAVGKLVAEWTADLPGPGTPPATASLIDMEVAMAHLDPEVVHAHERPGDPAGFGCPDCGGSLFVIDEPPLRRYRCRVGHAWSPETLIARQTVEMEGALWMALRALEEKSALNDDLARRAEAQHQDTAARRFAESAQEATRAAELVRHLIKELGATAGEHD